MAQTFNCDGTQVLEKRFPHSRSIPRAGYLCQALVPRARTRKKKNRSSHNGAEREISERVCNPNCVEQRVLASRGVPPFQNAAHTPGSFLREKGHPAPGLRGGRGGRRGNASRPRPQTPRRTGLERVYHKGIDTGVRLWFNGGLSGAATRQNQPTRRDTGETP
jgi:hypothetical protein